MRNFLLFSLLTVYVSAWGNSALPPPLNEVCVGVNSTLGNIVISETNPDDFVITGSPQTIVLSVPFGTFITGAGESMTVTGSPFVTASLNVTSSQVTITLTESNNDNDTELNTITIEGLRYQAVSSVLIDVSFSESSTIIINGMTKGVTAFAQIKGNDAPTGQADSLEICNGEVIAYDLQYDNIDSYGNSVPSSFEWFATTNPNVTGESTSTRFENIMDDGLTNVSAVLQYVNYSVTPTSLSGGCIGSSFIVTVGVKLDTIPSIVIQNNKPVIPSGGATSIALSSNLGGVTFLFAGNNPNVTGITSGSGNFIADTLINIGGPAQTVVYVISAFSLQGCYAGPMNTNVTVNGYPSVISSDSVALVALYTSTNGSGWGKSNNWLVGAVDTWHGIKVSNNRVEKILLDTNRVTGVLPPEIGDLTALTALSIRGDNVDELTGAIPSQIGNLVNLTKLDLSANSITSLPATIASLTNLDTLDVSGNQLSGVIPPGIVTLTGLRLLALSENLLTGAVPDFSTFPGPLALRLNDNDLSVLPDLSSGNFSELNVIFNHFTFEDIEPNSGIPGISFGTQKMFPSGASIQLGSGETFTASFTVGGSANQYQWTKDEVTIPGATSNTYTKTNITVADKGVYGLTVTNPLCSGLTLYSEPIQLDISLTNTADSLAVVALYNSTGGSGWVNKSNWLTGSITSWYGLTVTSGRVTSINLGDNKLTGSLPPALGNLTALTDLNLGGTIPDAKSTNVNRNAISGTIPSFIGSLTSLTKLNLSSNNFTGSIPTNISGLTQLQELWLSGNNLTLGTFPPEILLLTNLEYIKLSFCGITGGIPTQIQNLTLLKGLLLNDNQITGLPVQIANLSQLASFYVNNNRLVDLPNMSPISQLSDLRVEGNRLTFEDLEPNAGVSSFTYSPQDSVGVKGNIFIQAGNPHTFTSSVGGTSNQYTWKKDSIAISGATGSTYVIASPDFVHEGEYTFEVTNTVVPGLTLFGRPVKVKVSSIKRDSLALVQLYNNTKGNTWTNKTGWLSGNLSTWNGVTVINNRVTGVNLANNNLDGAIPPLLDEMFSLATINISNNKITALPPLPSLSQLIAFDVSGNKLDFASFESNLTKLGVMTYANQADIGVSKTDSVSSGSPYALTITTGGSNNSYQWKRNNATIVGATASNYNIAALSRVTMGEYICEVTNSAVPGLTLKLAPQSVLAVADLSGKLLTVASAPVTNGSVSLFRVTSANGYDTMRIVNVEVNGAYSFKRVVLDNYQILGFPDTLTYAGALPTYYQATAFWEEADTLFVQGPMSGLDILSQFKPSTPLTGTGVISGIVVQDDGIPGGRVKKEKRIGGAGVSVRRVESTGRGKGIVLVLVAHVFTNANGEFEIPKLPPADYRLNIQYPGYPMDEESFVNFPITESQSKVSIKATVTESKIVVRETTVAGISWQEEYFTEAYPNPCTESVTIRFASTSPSREVELLDILGKKVTKADAPDSHISLDVRSVKRGMYLIKVNDKNSVVKSLRIVVE